MIAYRHHEADEPKFTLPVSSEALLDVPYLGIELPERETLIKALRGDVKLMGELIQKWDIDAQLLGGERLDSDKFLLSQKIVRALNDSYDGPLEFTRGLVIDDMGAPFELRPRDRLVPQTVMSADILLAIAKPQNIVALPKGHSSEHRALEFDRYAGDRLFLENPEIAFVSKLFSDHYTLQLLEQQGVELFFVEYPYTVETLCKTIVDMGDVIDEPLKGRLLSLFVEALFLTLDNWRSHQQFPESKILVVSYYNRFSEPGTKTLTHHYLTRMGIKGTDQEGFSVPIPEEEIAHFNPDLLILMTDNENIVPKLHIDCKIVTISEKIQLSPSQFMALAYYDLNKALLSLYQNRPKILDLDRLRPCQIDPPPRPAHEGLASSFGALRFDLASSRLCPNSKSLTDSGIHE